MPRPRGLNRGLARFGAWGMTLLACWMLALLLLQAVSYTHLTLPTNLCV